MQRTVSHIGLLIVLLFATSACQFVKKIVDPTKTVRKEITTKTYVENGLSFVYADNWRVTEDEILENGVRYVNIEDKDNTLFIVSLFTVDDSMDLDEYAENIKATLPSEVPIGKISEVTSLPVNRVIAGNNLEGIRHRFSMKLLGQDIPHTQDVFQIVGKEYAPMIVIQAPDEDWAAAEKEFQVIFDSLKFE